MQRSSLRIEFVSLGNVGAKPATNIQQTGCSLIVRGLDRNAAQPFLDAAAM
jgi:hypothetical protein